MSAVTPTPWALRPKAVSEWSVSPTPLLPAILRDRLALKVVADRVDLNGQKRCVFARDLGADFWSGMGRESRAPKALLVFVQRLVKRHEAEIAPWPAFDGLCAPNIPLQTLPIPIRTLNLAKREGWQCIADLKDLTFEDLQRAPSLGTRAILELTCCVEAVLEKPVKARPPMSADEMVEALILNFSERDWRVLESRVLCGTPRLTMKALGQEIGVSGNHVRCLEVQTRIRLKKVLRHESAIALFRFALRIRETCGDTVTRADLERQLAHCPGMDRLDGIWRERLQKLVLWMATSYVTRELEVSKQATIL